MNTVDLGGDKASSSTYLPTSDGQTVKPNTNYLLSFLVSRLSVNDNDAAEGDFIRFKTDYAQADKAVTFNKPVVIGNDLFADGEISISDELELYFNGFTWQDSSNSTAPILDVGVFATSTSKQILVSDLVNTVFDKPLHLTIEAAGGCGGATMYKVGGYNTGVGGGAGGYAAVELVVFPALAFPSIEFLSGAGGKMGAPNSQDASIPQDGGTSTLTIDGELIAEMLGGGKAGVNSSVPASGAAVIYHDSAISFLYNEIVRGNDSTPERGTSKELSCKYRTFAPEYNGKWGGRGGYTALGTVAKHSVDCQGFTHSTTGRIQITYRPATADEIAAQEALNAA